METSSVNNNAAGYTTAGAVTGAGIGIATGYLTRPYLKNGTMTDEFVKKVVYKQAEAAGLEEVCNEAMNAAKDKLNSVKNAQSFDELKQALYGDIINPKGNCQFSKKLMQDVCEQVASITGEHDNEFIEKLKKVENFEQMKTVFDEDLDKKFKGKTLEEAKSAVMNDIKATEKKARDMMFKPYWDSAKKKFINCEDEFGKILKKTAQSIQGKYAAIYGAVGAAVLGGITYLCTRKGNSEQ